MTWNKLNVYGLVDRFQERTQQEIYKFNQVDIDVNEYNESIWIQSERDELSYQLNMMIDEMKEWLGFYPRPIWKEITIPLDQYISYWGQLVKVPESAWLNDFGVRATTVIEAGADYSKNDDVVTFTITTTEIESGEIALFHTSDDAFGTTADERFRVTPSSIYYNGTSYIIKVPYARLIKPVKWETEYTGDDPKNRKTYSKSLASNFAASLDVYRVYNDNTIKASILGPPLDYSSNTENQEQIVNVTVLDVEESVFKIQGNVSYTFDPLFVKINAYIGMPLTSQGFMNSVIEEFIIRRAKVDMGINARLASAKISTQWDFDETPAYTKANPNSGMAGVGFVPNPVGARNVDVEMFKKLMPIANWRGKILDKRFWIR